jgi:hypothetical protein
MNKIVVGAIAGVLALGVVGAGVEVLVSNQHAQNVKVAQLQLQAKQSRDAVAATALKAKQAALAKSAQNTPPKVVVQQAPAPAPVYVNPPVSGNSLGLPNGLNCSDLAARGYSYSDAVSYYNSGASTLMDIDNDGIPCETVYSHSDLVSYWGSDSRLYN